tara:strand:+ start:387 stop:656 length:270 start_codon:yes stop_codon:yes gene_type:complete
MAKLLMSKDNPKGWKLEDLLTTLQDEVVERMSRIRGDNRPEARRVLENSAEIITMLGDCSLRAQDSVRILDSLGSKRGATGSPRIGPET